MINAALNTEKEPAASGFFAFTEQSLKKKAPLLAHLRSLYSLYEEPFKVEGEEVSINQHIAFLSRIQISSMPRVAHSDPYCSVICNSQSLEKHSELTLTMVLRQVCPGGFVCNTHVL